LENRTPLLLFALPFFLGFSRPQLPRGVLLFLIFLYLGKLLFSQFLRYICTLNFISQPFPVILFFPSAHLSPFPPQNFFPPIPKGFGYSLLQATLKAPGAMIFFPPVSTKVKCHGAAFRPQAVCAFFSPIYLYPKS